MRFIIKMTILFGILSNGMSAQNNSGHFKYGLIKIESTDSLDENTAMVDMFYNTFKSESEYDLYFNTEKSVTIREKNDVLFRMVYDDHSLLNYTFLETKKGKYFSIDSSVLLLKAGFDSHANEHHILSEEEKAKVDSLNQFLKVSDALEDMKTILGFKCSKVTLMSPHNLDEVFSICYTTDKIPFPDEGFGPYSTSFPGIALETTVFVNNLSIISGVISFDPEIKDKSIFSEKTKGYKQVSSDEIKALQYEE